MTYIPDRGDLIWLEFDPQAGVEQAGRRPAIILSPAAYNEKTGLAICCPITNQVKKYPFEVLLPKDLKEVSGAILSDHIKSLDWKKRKAKFIIKAPQTIIDQVAGKLATLLP